MKLEGGFWENFRAALGIGLGGGLGWTFGQHLAGLAIRVVRWAAVMAVGVIFAQSNSCTREKEPLTVDERAAAITKLSPTLRAEVKRMHEKSGGSNQ